MRLEFTHEPVTAAQIGALRDRDGYVGHLGRAPLPARVFGKPFSRCCNR